MARLTQRDIRQLLECVGELHTHHDLNSFGEHALALCRRLVVSTYGTYNGANLRTGRGWYVSDPAGLEFGFRPEDMRIIAGVHPLMTHYRKTGDGAPRKLSDFMSRARYHESLLYREYFGRLGVEDMICSYLPDRPWEMVAIALIRDRGNFTERDRLLLELIRPHMAQAYRNAETITRLQEMAQLSMAGLDATNQGVVVLGPHGRVRFCSSHARKWLGQHLGRPARLAGDRLPPEVQRWVQSQAPPGTQSNAIPSRGQSLVLEREGVRLTIQLVPAARPGEQVLLLEQRPTSPSAAPLRRLGLTAREAEVLLWVAQGKTSPETGIILGCSTATVNKHLEHILAKLGVETRTAAAAQAFEVLDVASA